MLPTSAPVTASATCNGAYQGEGPDLAQSRSSQAGTNAGDQEEGWAGLLSTRAGGFQMSHSHQIEAIRDLGRGQPK